MGKTVIFTAAAVVAVAAIVAAPYYLTLDAGSENTCFDPRRDVGAAMPVEGAVEQDALAGRAMATGGRCAHNKRD